MISLPHILILFLVVFVLFGANRFPNMMGDLAKGIKAFKHGLKEEDQAKLPKKEDDQKSGD